ncbi:hypothetical protein [Mesorhizobium sp. L48C026A00]|uniref:hypothetical protein n=1 Tax=Mesorhizobium sp. L48C026A00 TaxID=1287182 RepID=UPI0003CFCD88|nr:hypothetical protein [Mesorhizobium sp. L48C026A00]ESZ11270.1 hypothetical protein X737_29850 [Mesorhizobium sp. L48C026A00]
MLGDFAIFGGLFLTAFAAAIMLPMQSEAAVAGLLLTTTYAPLLLILTATAGNVLESVVNPHARFNHADHGCCWSFRLNSL